MEQNSAPPTDWEPEDIPREPNRRRMQKYVRCLLLYSAQMDFLNHEVPMIFDLERHASMAKHYVELYWKYVHAKEA